KFQEESSSARVTSNRQAFLSLFPPPVTLFRTEPCSFKPSTTAYKISKTGFYATDCEVAPAFPSSVAMFLYHLLPRQPEQSEFSGLDSIQSV
ncbi:hypothetical protein WG66_006342, partial [Moniliophthora roreri]